MGKQFPVASIALGIAGVLALAGALRASSRRARTASFVLAAACSVGWSVAALLSIVNTLV